MGVGLFCVLVFVWLPPIVSSYSIEKQLIEASKSPEMFDLFHVMPDGMVKVIQELDMLLDLDQYKQLYMEKNGPQKRKAVADTGKQWTNCHVFFEITESLDTLPDRKIIREAMDEWEKYTCLDFIESSTAERRILFQDGDMCSSEVGMQKKVQSLTLASGCRTKGIIIHEIGHAIGWFHEHMRPDRDEYLNVQFSVIPEKFKIHFKKYNTDIINTYNISYDYTSIMHYGNTGFPNSLIARDPRFQRKMGQRDGLSFKDIKLANVMYNCAAVMHCPRKECGVGFQFYKKIKNERPCQCWCDSGNVKDPLVLCSQRKATIPPPVPTLPPPTVVPPMECMDIRDNCKTLKTLGKCMTKMVLMKDTCAKTCGYCGKGEGMCMDYEMGCGPMAVYCNDPGLKSTMSQMCMASCDLCHKPPDPCAMQKEMLRNDDFSNDNTASRQGFNVVLVILSTCAMLILSASSVVF